MKRLTIGICDDEIMAVLQIQKMVRGYLEKEKKNADILTFYNGKELLEYAEKLDILFLDIEMPGQDGIEVGNIIYKRNPYCKMIMATSHEERFKEAFKIHAFRFATKPFSELEIEEVLQDALKGMIGAECIELYEDRVLYKIEQRRIKYIKAYGGYVEATVGNRILRKETSLLKLEKTLDATMFYRVDRNLMVNLFYVDAYENGIIFIGKEKYKISRRRKKQFEEKYLKFDLEYRG